MGQNEHYEKDKNMKEQHQKCIKSNTEELYCTIFVPFFPFSVHISNICTLKTLYFEVMSPLFFILEHCYGVNAAFSPNTCNKHTLKIIFRLSSHTINWIEKVTAFKKKSEHETDLNYELKICKRCNTM